MLTLFCETGTRGKERPTRMLHGSPDACTRIACRRMHREKKPWMSVGFRHDRAPRVLLPISLHLLATPCAQPGLFPRPPSLRQPWLQVSLVPLAWHHRRAAHRLPGTALKDPQTARCSMASSWRGAPRLHKVPVTRGRRRAWAGLHKPAPSQPAARFPAEQACNPNGVLAHASAQRHPWVSTRKTARHAGEEASAPPQRPPGLAPQVDGDDGGGLPRDPQACAGAPPRALARNAGEVSSVTTSIPGVARGGGRGVHGHPVRLHLCAAHAHAWHDRAFRADGCHTPAPVSVLLQRTAWVEAGDACHEGARRARSQAGARLWCSSPPDCVRHPSTCSSHAQDRAAGCSPLRVALVLRVRKHGAPSIFLPRSVVCLVSVAVHTAEHAHDPCTTHCTWHAVQMRHPSLPRNRRREKGKILFHSLLSGTVYNFISLKKRHGELWCNRPS